VVLRHEGAFRVGLARAVELQAEWEWLWVLDGRVAPRADALLALLEALRRMDGLPEPAVLVSVLRAPDGRLDQSGSLWYRRNQIDPAMLAAARHLLPVRAAAGPLLVHREAVESEQPRADAEVTPATVFEWTARILRFRTGYLVADSEVDALAPGADPLADPVTVTRLLLGGALIRFDRVRLGYELVERIESRLSRGGSAARRSGP